ncbi:protein kinase domain-containing protein [Streptomyces sp. NRRL WC-3742]|uniref:protein kinase domain-containing protein n=1 Tax=Streptomyces sp. NRRL WC-3742 TaxID=1463934 RepID=UPI00131C66EB|nr:hypothetical protein [Streptomyces sp. NRRL WC-3742]
MRTPGDDGPGPRETARTRVDRRPWWRRDVPGEGHGPDPAGTDRPSRLGRRPDPATRVDPDATTIRRPGDRADPEAATTVLPPPRWAAGMGPGPHRADTAPEAPAPGRPFDEQPFTEQPPKGRPFEGSFPDALRGRFAPLERAGSGSEGTVWRVRRAAGGEAAVKVSAAGHPMDATLLAHLGNDRFRRHVPHLIDYGKVRHNGAEVDWVAMEYLPVTLSAHFAALRRGGHHTDRWLTEQIVRELVSLLDFWQRSIERNPLDFKPANILVRPGEGSGPGQFVIADFGGVDRLTASRRFTSQMTVTIAYMAPEQLAGNNHRAGPWWALGNVLYELFVGRPRFVGADGRAAPDREMELELVVGEEADLSAVTDPRQLLLLQGLFTRQPDDRWTAAEVRSWLEGASPPVVRRRPQSHRPISYHGASYSDPARLVEVLLRDSLASAEWLATGGAQRLRTWLSEDVRDTVFDLHYLTEVVQAPGALRTERAGVAVLALGVAFLQAATPQYLGRQVDTTGLEHIAAETATDGYAFIEQLVACGAASVAARYDCFHPECAGDHCSRLLALAALPQVMVEVERAARTVGGGRRGGDGLSPGEREEARRLAVWLSLRPRERERVLGRLSPLPAALHRLPLPVRASEIAAVVASAVVDAALAAGARTRTAVRAAARRPVQAEGAEARPEVRRRWSALRRRALGADPAEAGGRAALIAAETLRPRSRAREESAGRTEGVAGTGRPGRVARWWQDRRRPPVDLRGRVRAWWPHARRALPRRAVAALLLLLGFGLLLWAGAVIRHPVEAGEQLKILPNGAFGGPLRTAGEQAARQVVGQLGAAFTAAVLLAFFPARVGVGTAFLTGAGAFAIGYLRLGPPLLVVEAPGPVADRVVMFEGGMGSWAGIIAVVAVVLSLALIDRAARRFLKPAHEARRLVRAAWRQLERRSGGGAGPAGRKVASAGERKQRQKQWRPGGAGTRDRLRFALVATGVLVLLLWAAVEVRLAVTGHHPTAHSWGTGQTGAAYQAGFVILLAVASLACTFGTPVTARVLFGAWILGTLFLGAWPRALGPIEALRIPVLQGWFGGIAEWWGHAAFWAALLIALPLAGYGVLRTMRWPEVGD